MHGLTAILYTLNDGLRLGRALDSLRACDQIIVIDQGSTDNTEKVARDHGAEFKATIPDLNREMYVMDAAHDWILYLSPNESLSDTLEAALFEWKATDHGEAHAYCLAIREETHDGWKTLTPEPRLMNRRILIWTGERPSIDGIYEVLQGHLLRFHHP